MSTSPVWSSTYRSVAAVAVRIHDRRVGHVMHFVVQHLVAGGREDGVGSDAEIQRSGVIHDSLKQVVNVIEGDGVVVRERRIYIGISAVADVNRAFDSRHRRRCAYRDCRGPGLA